MNISHWTLGVCAALAVAGTAVCSTSELTVKTDRECRISIDGKDQGVLKPDSELKLSLESGEHKLEAAALSGAGTWAQTLDVKDSSGQSVTIPMQSAASRSEIQQLEYWTDPASGLQWAAEDNGSAISWSQADRYCRASARGGFKDWRLPTIQELHGIFGGVPNERGYRLVSPLKLTGWAWSSNEGREPGEAWVLDFGDGGQASTVAGDAGLNRALCVRTVR